MAPSFDVIAVAPILPSLGLPVSTPDSAPSFGDEAPGSSPTHAATTPSAAATLATDDTSQNRVMRRAFTRRKIHHLGRFGLPKIDETNSMKPQKHVTPRSTFMVVPSSPREWSESAA